MARCASYRGKLRCGFVFISNEPALSNSSQRRWQACVFIASALVLGEVNTEIQQYTNYVLHRLESVRFKPDRYRHSLSRRQHGVYLMGLVQLAARSHALMQPVPSPLIPRPIGQICTLGTCASPARSLVSILDDTQMEDDFCSRCRHLDDDRQMIESSVDPGKKLGSIFDPAENSASSLQRIVFFSLPRLSSCGW